MTRARAVELLEQTMKLELADHMPISRSELIALLKAYLESET